MGAPQTYLIGLIWLFCAPIHGQNRNAGNTMAKTTKKSCGFRNSAFDNENEDEGCLIVYLDIDMLILILILS